MRAPHITRSLGSNTPRNRLPHFGVVKWVSIQGQGIAPYLDPPFGGPNTYWANPKGYPK